MSEWNIEPDLIRLQVRGEQCYVSRGNTVLAMGRDGFIEGGEEQGLFVRQTRVLNRYRCRIGRIRPFATTVSNVHQHNWIGYYVVPAPGSDDASGEGGLPQRSSQQTLEMRVARRVGEGMHEDYDLTNYSKQPVRTRLTLEFDADFADAEETKGERRQQGRVKRQWRREGDAWELSFDYRASHRFSHQGERGSASIHRGITLRIECADTPPRHREGRIQFDIELQPHERWHACLHWIVHMDGDELSAPRCGTDGDQRAHADPDFMRDATDFASAESRTLAPLVVQSLERAREDLAALRLPRFDQADDAWTVSAGIPMYVALFGRDVLTTAYGAAMLGPELLRGTLPLLAQWQGRRDDEWRDEQPGRILHEAHPGPLAQLGFNPRDRYYGSLTSASLYPIVLGQLWQWTGDRKAVEPLLDPALRALAWMDRHARLDHGHFYAITTRSREGLKNQTWKDSDDSVVDEDGEIVEQPVATCEEQAFVFAAKRTMAQVLADLGREGEARRMSQEAHELRQRFEDAFWMDDADCYAMALAPDGRQVRSIGSNALRCVSSGIVDPSRVGRLMERLFQDDMFSGWGMRTLSSQHPAFNPYAYHRGTVWPVEHGATAQGCGRYGLHDCMHRLAQAMFEVAGMFEFRRLPECFSGHPRDEAHPFPAIYPASNSPHAWSASTMVALVQAMLGVYPFAGQRVLRVAPQLPEWLPQITLRGLRVGQARVDLAFNRKADGTTSFEVLGQQGEVRVVAGATGWDVIGMFGDELHERVLQPD